MITTIQNVDDKYDYYNLVVTVTPAKDNYIKNLSQKAVSVEYQKNDLEQVNPQLYKWLSIVNPKSSIDSISSKTDSVKLSDKEYLSFAQKVKDGTTTDAETETLRKAVDAAAKANGYIYGRAYHGTDYYKDITVFKRGKGGYLGSGIYFSDRQDTAQRYANRMGDGGKVYGAFLKINNPLNVSSADPAKEILRVAYGSDRIYNERVRNQANQSQLLQRKDIAKLQAKGYDGIIWKMERGVETEYSVFDPSQIKSADLVTYDNDGNIIPLSERFNKNDDDIRYSTMDNIKLNRHGNTRTFELKDSKATLIGNDVELDGGTIRQRVAMMKLLAEHNDLARVDAASVEEAEAFRRAGAVQDEMEGRGKYGTFEFKYQRQVGQDICDPKQKVKFAKDIVKYKMPGIAA